MNTRLISMSINQYSANGQTDCETSVFFWRGQESAWQDYIKEYLVVRRE